MQGLPNPTGRPTGNLPPMMGMPGGLPTQQPQGTQPKPQGPPF